MVIAFVLRKMKGKFAAVVETVKPPTKIDKTSASEPLGKMSENKKVPSPRIKLAAFEF